MGYCERCAAPVTPKYRSQRRNVPYASTSYVTTFGSRGVGGYMRTVYGTKSISVSVPVCPNCESQMRYPNCSSANEALAARDEAARVLFAQGAALLMILIGGASSYFWIVRPVLDEYEGWMRVGLVVGACAVAPMALGIGLAAVLGFFVPPLLADVLSISARRLLPWVFWGPVVAFGAAFAARVIEPGSERSTLTIVLILCVTYLLAMIATEFVSEWEHRSRLVTLSREERRL